MCYGVVRMKIATFDVETASGPDMYTAGISCAAIATEEEGVQFWHTPDRIPQEKAIELVRYLQELVKDGYTLVTWNGCGFDFRVLANASGLVFECYELALMHVDLMLIVTFTKGYYLGLEAALKGAGLSGKRHSVTLSDGTELTEMSGAMAPELWDRGEYDAVLAYLYDDVAELLSLAKCVVSSKVIKWHSKRGNPMAVRVPTLLPVIKCFDIPEPDTSWMGNAPSRQDFIAWGKSE